MVRLFRGGEPLKRAILRLLDNFWIHAAARRIVSTWKPDVVYERYALTAFAGAWLARDIGVPFVLEVNAPLASEEQGFRNLRLGALAYGIERMLLRRADRVIVVSRALHEWVVSHGVPAERVLVLPNAGVAGWSVSESDARAVRAREGLDDDAFVVGFCGSLKPWHGVTHLLEAAARAAETIHNLRVLIVGDGPERQALERRAAALGVSYRTRFVGRMHFAMESGWMRDTRKNDSTGNCSCIACQIPRVDSRADDNSKMPFNDGWEEYGASGWSFEAFAAAEERARIPPEAVWVELVVNQFLTEAPSGELYDADAFHENLSRAGEKMGLAQTRRLEADEIARVRGRIVTLVSRWRALEPGDTLELPFALAGT